MPDIENHLRGENHQLSLGGKVCWEDCVFFVRRSRTWLVEKKNREGNNKKGTNSWCQAMRRNTPTKKQKINETKNEEEKTACKGGYVSGGGGSGGSRGILANFDC